MDPPRWSQQPLPRPTPLWWLPPTCTSTTPTWASLWPVLKCRPLYWLTSRPISVQSHLPTSYFRWFPTSPPKYTNWPTTSFLSTPVRPGFGWSPTTVLFMLFSIGIYNAGFLPGGRDGCWPGWLRADFSGDYTQRWGFQDVCFFAVLLCCHNLIRIYQRYGVEQWNYCSRQTAIQDQKRFSRHTDMQVDYIHCYSC